MRYKVTCLTPTLVGDGNRLAAIDYMVWKDHVNVLDQTRIFRLLARGPRLEGYLSQLKKGDRFDFASWGGFAQNYASRRIPFENPAYSQIWNRATGDSLAIPTFAAGPAGKYLPGAPLKGALRTGVFAANLRSDALAGVAQQFEGERQPRRVAETLEDQVLGAAGVSRMRLVKVGDSNPISFESFKVYLLRVATLVAKGPNAYALGWKTSPRGAVDGARPEDSTPWFAEMAVPGTSCEGTWTEDDFLANPDVRRFSRWPGHADRSRFFEAANEHAAKLLASHRQYAEWAKLERLAESLAEIEGELGKARESGACLLSIGWGGGLLAKTAFPDTSDADYRRILQKLPFYGRAINPQLPFPKTRRVVFLNNRPATLPGWVRLEIS